MVLEYTRRSTWDTPIEGTSRRTTWRPLWWYNGARGQRAHNQHSAALWQLPNAIREKEQFWLEERRNRVRIVSGTGPNCQVDSGSSSTRNRTVATGLTTRTTWTIGNGPVLTLKPRHFQFTKLAPIKYLSSHWTMTWSVGTLCSFRRSFTSHCGICDLTNIRWVAILNPQIFQKICCD